MRILPLIILSLCLCPGSYAQDDDCNPWLEQAAQELKAGKVVDAFGLYAREVELNWHVSIPTPPNSWLEQVGQEMGAGDLVSALCFYSLETKLSSDSLSPAPFIKLGNCYSELGHMELALVNFDKALEVTRRLSGSKEDKRFCEIYFNSAKAFDDNHMHKEAIILYEKTIELDPDYPNVKNLCAWILATSHDSTLRDGYRALELAKLECAHSGWKNYGHLDTYAAAQAVCGNFGEAIKWQLMAIARADEEDALEGLKRRLRYYQRGESYKQKLARPKPESVKDAKNTRDIERFVRRYIRATQGQSWNAISAMIHPDSQEAMKEGFRRALLMAINDRREVSRYELEEILETFRLKTITELKSLNGKEFVNAMNRSIHNAYGAKFELTPRNQAEVEIESIAVLKEQELTIAILKHVVSWRDKKIEWYSTIFIGESNNTMKILSVLHASKYLPDVVGEQIKQLKESIDQAYLVELKNNDEAVASLIDWFIFRYPDGRDSDEDERFILEIGEPVNSMVLAILNDPYLYKRLVNKRLGIRWKTPFDRACQLLGDAPSEEAGFVIAPYLKDPNVRIRTAAASVIGKVGQLSSIPYLRTAFEDTDSNVRSYALMGVLQALNRNQLPVSYTSQLYPDIKSLLEEGKNSMFATCVLYVFDPDKATKFFLSPAVFSPDSKVLRSALDIFEEDQIMIPRDKLLSLIDALESDDLKKPQTYMLRDALRLLGLHKLKEDWPLLEKMMNHPQDRVAKGAADGLLIAHGFGDIMKRLRIAEKEFGYDSLSIHQRYFLSVNRSDGMVSFLGILAYLHPILNSLHGSSGDHWRDALVGYKVMGFTEKFEAFRDALIVFGDYGPSEDLDEREEQLKNLTLKNKYALKAAEKRYKDGPDLFEVVIARFVLANSESFR